MTLPFQFFLNEVEDDGIFLHGRKIKIKFTILRPFRAIGNTATPFDMKAIIPVAGAGTKLRPHTYTQPKALIPLAGKTILSIIVDQLMEAGITEFIFIVGYLGEKIQDFVKQKYPQLSAHFVYQNERQGI